MSLNPLCALLSLGVKAAHSVVLAALSRGSILLVPAHFLLISSLPNPRAPLSDSGSTITPHWWLNRGLETPRNVFLKLSSKAVRLTLRPNDGLLHFENRLPPSIVASVPSKKTIEKRSDSSSGVKPTHTRP